MMRKVGALSVLLIFSALTVVVSGTTESRSAGEGKKKKKNRVQIHDDVLRQADRQFQNVLDHYSTFSLLYHGDRQKHAQKDNINQIKDHRHRQRRQLLLDHLNSTYGDDNPTTTAEEKGHQQQGLTSSQHINNRTINRSMIRKWTIQGKTEPMFLCPECYETLVDEQRLIIETFQALYPKMKVVGQTTRIFNGIYIELEDDDGDDDDSRPFLTQGILSDYIERIVPQRHYTIDSSAALLEENAERIGSTILNKEPYCYTGEGMKVGILDTGIDYTHQAFDGPGTLSAYQLAYGLDSTDQANKQRDGYFPTPRVIDGYDYLGEDLENFIADDDPIDSIGHGTAVASAILGVAPDTQIVAIKSCNDQECPDFAIIAGIEYLLDPNFDGNLNDRVDVINLSLGSAFDTAYYNSVAYALELANFLGVVVVTSLGNYGNVPYSAGAIGTSPNAISVGATNGHDPNTLRHMTEFSSRGPGDANFLKPNLSAPGEHTNLALVGSGMLVREMKGTSFSAPLVAGAAILLRQKCPECSPFGIRAILMNTADREVKYSETSLEMNAPITRMGSGEIRIDRALEASIWAYSVDDFQPSIGLGLVDAYVNLRYTRQIIIYSLAQDPQAVNLSYEFRSPDKQNSTVVEINFDWTESIIGGCDNDNESNEQQEQNVLVATIEFLIYADRAPANTMTTSGTHGYNPEMLDRHEFDGHIIITASPLSPNNGEGDENGIAVPFHMIVRQAAAPRLGENTFLPNRGLVNTNFTIYNEGAGIAQIDAFELVYSDADDPEPAYGEEGSQADIKTIGYRTVPVGQPACEYIIEFNIQTWERSRHAGSNTYSAQIFLDTISPPVTMWVPPVPEISETLIIEADGTSRCTGLSSDHSSNSANTIIRACSNDLGLKGNITFYARFFSDTYPLRKSVSWGSGIAKMTFPIPRLYATSYDIYPDESFDGVTVMGEIDEDAYGIQFVTNSFRDFNRTGASNASTETLNVAKQGIILQQEVTPDIFLWPGDENRIGPQCQSWTTPASNTCPPNPTSENGANGGETIDSKSSSVSRIPLQDGNSTEPGGDSPGCPPVEIPRVQVPTLAPTLYPTEEPTAPTGAPSPVPSFRPKIVEIPNPTSMPITDMPSDAPSSPPITSGGSKRSSGFRVWVSFASWITACILVWL